MWVKMCYEFSLLDMPLSCSLRRSWLHKSCQDQILLVPLGDTISKLNNSFKGYSFVCSNARPLGNYTT